MVICPSLSHSICAWDPHWENVFHQKDVQPILNLTRLIIQFLGAKLHSRLRAVDGLAQRQILEFIE